MIQYSFVCRQPRSTLWIVSAISTRLYELMNTDVIICSYSFMAEGKFMTLLPRFLARLPKIPGADLAGIVEVSTSSLFSPGDTVTGIHREGRKGSLSTHIVASPSELARVSAGKDAKVSFAQAAGLPIVGITAWNLAREVKEGDRVFVNGGSTGVGLILTQLCRHRGASFVAASASGEKCNIVKERGVDEVIDCE